MASHLVTVKSTRVDRVVAPTLAPTQTRHKGRRTTAKAHTFPIGAWVRDPGSKHWYNGLRHDNDGGVHFEPNAGEITALGHFGPFAAYIVQFGDCQGFVFEPECYSCGTDDDSSHADGCYSLFSRDLRHDTGFAPA